jgi:hypothetical protein
MKTYRGVGVYGHVFLNHGTRQNREVSLTLDLSLPPKIRFPLTLILGWRVDGSYSRLGLNDERKIPTAVEN